MSATQWCKSCHKAIRWYPTEKGKRMCIDADPVTDGRVVIEVGRIRVLKSGETYQGQRYTSHFETCPDAKKHRKRSSTAEPDQHRPDSIARAIRQAAWRIRHDEAPKATAYIYLAAGAQVLHDLGIDTAEILNQAERAMGNGRGEA